MEYELSDYKYLTVEKGVCGGRPIIRGTRIEPEHICMYFNVEEVLFNFPHLKKEEVMECFHYFVHQL